MAGDEKSKRERIFSACKRRSARNREGEKESEREKERNKRRKEEEERVIEIEGDQRGGMRKEQGRREILESSEARRLRQGWARY